MGTRFPSEAYQEEEKYISCEVINENFQLSLSLLALEDDPYERGQLISKEKEAFEKHQVRLSETVCNSQDLTGSVL